MASIEDYKRSLETARAAKPADGRIDGQTAQVSSSGHVIVTFVSDDTAKITALRDWLTSLLGEEL